MATKKTTTRSKSTKAAAKPAAKPAAKTKKAAAAAAPAEAAEVAVRGTDSPVLKESHAPVVKESPVPAEAVKAEAPAVAEPAQAPAVAEEKPARTRKSKAAAKPAVLKPRADGGMLREITPRPQQAGNPYKPMLATVVETIQETGNIKTLRVVLDDPEQMANFTYEPGQVGQLSVFGAGESTFVINTPPSQKEYLQFSVMQAGEVTSAIHRLSPGDKVGVRAPLGNFFPYNDWKGKNIFFVGGGIGMAPIRTIMLHVLEHKADYGKVSLLYGARSPRDMAFSYELDGWLANPDLDCTLCIDNPYEGWPHKVGLIPNVLTELNPSPAARRS